MPADVKNVKMTVVLKYLSNLWRTFKIPLINFNVNLTLTWSAYHTTIDSTGK